MYSPLINRLIESLQRPFKKKSLILIFDYKENVIYTVQANNQPFILVNVGHRVNEIRYVHVAHLSILFMIKSLKYYTYVNIYN